MLKIREPVAREQVGLFIGTGIAPLLDLGTSTRPGLYDQTEGDEGEVGVIQDSIGSCWIWQFA